MTFILALLIGVVAGLRAMTAPAAVAWGAALGWLPLSGRPGRRSWAIASRPGSSASRAIVEYVADQLPSTPSRKVPQQFGARHRQRRASAAR